MLPFHTKDEPNFGIKTRDYEMQQIKKEKTDIEV